MNIRPIAITHANCPDGNAAAWVLWKAFGGDIDLHPGVYEEAPPDVTGRLVILADFSYKRPVMEKLCADAAWVTILDHHESAINDLRDFAPGNLTKILDNDRSGAKIVWDHFRPDIARFVDKTYLERADWFISCVQDRDLWKMEIPEALEVFLYCRSLTFSPETWEGLMELPSDELVARGEPFAEPRRAAIAEAVANAFPIKILGYDVLATCCEYGIGSEVAGELAKGRPFGAYYVDDDDWKWGLRSTPDGVNVAVIAEEFGGGGHVHASGFRTVAGQWPGEGTGAGAVAA